MDSLRKGLFAATAVLSPVLGQPAWAFDISQPAPAFLCQFADTAKAFAFRQGAGDVWQGLGQMQGWEVMVQPDGLVARKGDDVLILDEGTASLLQEGQLLRGTCVDAGEELAQLLSEEGPEADAPAERRSMPDSLIGEVLSLLDSGNWDEARLEQLIDELDMDRPAKTGLKAELRAAAKDPTRIAALARQIRAAFGQEMATSADLREKLRDAQRELDAVTQALNEARQAVQMGATKVKEAEARASAAVGANARAAEQIANLRSALNAAAKEEDDMRAILATAVESLKFSEARLALANKRIAKLGGVPVRP